MGSREDYILNSQSQIFVSRTQCVSDNLYRHDTLEYHSSCSLTNFNTPSNMLTVNIRFLCLTEISLGWNFAYIAPSGFINLVCTFLAVSCHSY